MNVEFEPLIERGERLARLFRKGYTRWTKDATVVPPPDSSTPLDDTTKPCDDSSKINSEWVASSIVLICLEVAPLVYEKRVHPQLASWFGEALRNFPFLVGLKKN
ncbi:hypothetical protein ACOSQ3_027201 [Xanthoceras sorbifolium]